MSKHLCMECGVESEPFGEFDPGEGTIWRCGNINGCKDPENQGTTCRVYPGQPEAPAKLATVTPITDAGSKRAPAKVGVQPAPIVLQEPRRLGDMVAELQARRAFVASEINKRAAYEQELTELDAILTRFDLPGITRTG